MIMELRHQKTNPKKGSGDYKEFFAKLVAIEERVGGLPPRRYFSRMVWSGGFAFTQMREWESLAQMEAAYLKLRGDPEFQALQKWSVEHELFGDQIGELYSEFTMQSEPGEVL
jgi:hypothetical protein